MGRVSFLWRRLTSPFQRRDLLEAGLVAAGFLAYFGVRGAVIDRPATAYWNARDIIELARSLGIFWEYEVHKALLGNLSLVQAMNIIYFWLHFPLIIVFGIWCYYRRRSHYTRLRDAFLASGAISLIVYWLYPVAPPRALPELAARFEPNAPEYVRGFVDTMQVYLGYAYQTQETGAFVNPYAAMPSLHFGWDMLLGMGIIWVFWRTRLRWVAVPVGLFLPISQVFAITVTANHFFLDALAGAVVSALGVLISVALHRWAYPRLGEWVSKIPWPTLRRFLLPEAAPGEGRVPPKASPRAGGQR
jgi:hypothetical protein